MIIPTPYKLTVRRYSSTQEDEYGNAVPVWAEEEIAVHGMAPGAIDLEDVTRNAEEVSWTVYAPAGTVVRTQDTVLIDGDEYQVIGRVKDWSQGPWANPVAGVVFELKRTEG